MSNPSQRRIVISWNELPAYGARLIRPILEAHPYEVSVIATRPTVPITGMDEILNNRIIWIDREGVDSWNELGMEVPHVYFQAGWYIDSFIRLGAKVRAQGGKIVVLADNSWRNTPRQWAGAIKYRLLYRRLFWGAWVPGKSGVKLMRTFGVPRARIYDGLYGSDPHAFASGLALSARSKQFIFVGRLIADKAVPEVARAFAAFRQDFPDWSLVVYGNGPCAKSFEGLPGVSVRSFAQPTEVADAMRNSRFLVLPSRVDHWPLVVSEASLSGCGLVLSDCVGNVPEFMAETAGFVCRAGSVSSLIAALSRAAELEGHSLDNIGLTARKLGLRYTPESWAGRFREIVRDAGVVLNADANGKGSPD